MEIGNLCLITSNLYNQSQTNSVNQNSHNSLLMTGAILHGLFSWKIEMHMNFEKTLFISAQSLDHTFSEDQTTWFWCIKQSCLVKHTSLSNLFLEALNDIKKYMVERLV